MARGQINGLAHGLRGAACKMGHTLSWTYTDGERTVSHRCVNRAVTTERQARSHPTKGVQMPFPPGVFNPETLTILTAAFDAACVELHHKDDNDVISKAARTLAALAILRVAEKGERDFERLKAAALSSADAALAPLP